MPDRYVNLPHTTNSNSHLPYTVYPVVFCTSCRVLASDPCPNCTVCLMDVWHSLILLMINSYLLPLCSIPRVLCTSFCILASVPCLNHTPCLINIWDSLLPAVYQVVVCLYFFICKLASGTFPNRTVYPAFFLHYYSCGDIRYLPKLHTVTSGYYSSTRNFQTIQYFHVLLHNKWMQHIFSFFLSFFLYFLLWKKSIFKATIEGLNLSEPIKHFFVIALCYSFLTVITDFCIFNKQFVYIVGVEN